MDRSQTGSGTEWDTTTYDEEHSFVFEHGENVVDLLDPTTGERILDLGVALVT